MFPCVTLWYSIKDTRFGASYIRHVVPFFRAQHATQLECHIGQCVLVVRDITSSALLPHVTMQYWYRGVVTT